MVHTWFWSSDYCTRPVPAIPKRLGCVRYASSMHMCVDVCVYVCMCMCTNKGWLDYYGVQYCFPVQIPEWRSHTC